MRAEADTVAGGTMCIPRPDENHLAQFRQAFDQEGKLWLGKAPQNWAQHVTGKLRPGLPLERQNRYELREWLIHKPTDDQLLAVCAWGGMRVGHGRAMWAAKDSPLKQDDLTRTLRCLPQLNRWEAYTRFQALRNTRVLPGVGPAYFTKLIHFMGPDDGYIMDQWTARSINLLFGPLIHLNRVARGGWRVADRNSAGHYERYCRCVEQLAVMLMVNPSEVEQALFAPGPWRNYLLAKPFARGPLTPAAE